MTNISVVRICSFSVLFFAGIVKGQIALSEIMFNPDGNEHHNEFVEFVNLGNAPLDLQGWRLSDGVDSDAIADAGYGLLLMPDMTALVLDPDYFTYSNLYEGKIPSDCLIVTIDGTTFGHGGLSNSAGEKISIVDGAGNILTAFLYWTDGPAGHSIEKIDLTAGDEPSNWAFSYTPGGTPGARNSVAIKPAQGRGELTVSPNPFSPDGDGFEDTTTIDYHLSTNGTAHLQIFDVAGRRIRTLLAAEMTGPAGCVSWDGRNEWGIPVRRGIYILCLEVLNGSSGISAALIGTVVVGTEH